MNIMIANSNPVYVALENKCRQELDATVITQAGELNDELLEKHRPRFIFFPHWSNIIPQRIWANFECVVFHMTDLPFGRGGSPLQNLIVRGINKTYLTAIRVTAGLDTGPIYCKEELPLYGTAEEIFLRAGDIMFKMMKDIITHQPMPQPQVGEPVHFNRRRPEDGNISNLKSVSEVYDYIRMLDSEGYPPAFLETENFRFEFKRASLKKDSIIADVIISKK